VYRRKRKISINSTHVLALSCGFALVILVVSRGASEKDIYPENGTLQSIKNSLSGAIVQKGVKPKQNQGQKTLPSKKDFASLMSFVREKPGTFSIYIKSEENAASFTYNENELYFGASLYKVPLAVAATKKMQDNTISSNTLIKYLPSDFYGGSGIIRNTKLYSEYEFENLTNLLLTHSDNVAQTMVERTLGEKTISTSFENLLGKADSPFYNRNLVTPMEIGAMFETLKRQGSQGDPAILKIISTASNTQFDDRITTYLTNPRKFSHKIGNWETTGSWHDCGIVYTSLDKLKESHVICVMSKGTKYESFLEVCEAVAKFSNKLP
jgi:beta-lactamase class A